MGAIRCGMWDVGRGFGAIRRGFRVWEPRVKGVRSGGTGVGR